MYIAVLILHLFVCFVLIAVILLQAGRGGGLADFVGGSTSNILGTRATTYLTKATSVCAVLFMFTSLGLAVMSAKQGQSLMEKQAAQQLRVPIPPPKPSETPATVQVTPPAEPAAPDKAQTP